ncbi:hypothetical protein DYB35_007499 [Aphanomyces astaci]|uniref:chitinase n=1 Tax=Aphanomyces astaci TaxID=112090 RepID=A0A3R7ALM8_APHAT|nr:hypothetical protein DYB35_007499 [Aphanomyces astaci]
MKATSCILLACVASAREIRHEEFAMAYPTAAQGTARLPTHNLVGYWHNFENPSGKTFPLSQISKDWDVINIAFADSLGSGALGLNIDPSAGSEAQFIADIAALKASGKIVALSLGGEKGSVTIKDATEKANFVNSLYGLITKYGFDGIDVDLENGVSIGAPIVQNLIDGIKQLKQRVGPTFYLSMAPEHPYVQGGYGQWGGLWGSYLAIIDALRDDLTQIHVQFYNNNGFTYPDGRYLREGTVDGLVGGSLMLLEGFTAQWGQGFKFNGLRADQVSIGVPSGKSSAGQGFVTEDVILRTLTCLTKGVGCDTVKPKKLYPDFRGLMSWSINWDRFDNFPFSKYARRALDLLNDNVTPTSAPPATSTPAPSTPAPTTSSTTSTPVTTKAPTTPAPTTLAPATTIQPPATTTPSGPCGSCTNCYYAPTQACFVGWTAQQCSSVATFQWCGAA